jgi:hypothetical protein
VHKVLRKFHDTHDIKVKDDGKLKGAVCVHSEVEPDEPTERSRTAAANVWPTPAGVSEDHGREFPLLG